MRKDQTRSTTLRRCPQTLTWRRHTQVSSIRRPFSRLWCRAQGQFHSFLVLHKTSPGMGIWHACVPGEGQRGAFQYPPGKGGEGVWGSWAPLENVSQFHTRSQMTTFPAFLSTSLSRRALQHQNVQLQCWTSALHLNHARHMIPLQRLQWSHPCRNYLWPGLHCISSIATSACWSQSFCPPSGVWRQQLPTVHLGR